MAEIKVFCLHCGQHIQCDEGYRGVQINCPSCSQSFLIPQVEQAAPPAASTLQIRRQRPDYVNEAKAWEADGTDTPHSKELNEIPALWNPYAAARWSILFSPIFGAIIHARNADTLGRKKEATANRVWFYISLFYFLAFGVAYCFANPQDEKGLNGISKFTSLALLCGWFYHVGKKQANHVKDDLAQNYQKKSWLLPLSIAFGISIPLMFAAVYSSDSFAKAKQHAESQQQQGVQENLEAEVKTDIQKKFAQDPATSLIKIQSFHLVHESGNKYKGLLELQADGKTETDEVDVTFDGKTFMWQIPKKTTNDGQSKTEANHSAFQNHAVLDYSFYGVKIGDSYSSVEKVFNLEFQPKESDSNMQKAVWDVSYQDQVATFYFLKGSLYRMQIMYNPEAVNKMGGHDAIHNKMVAEYGSEDDLDSSRKDYIKYTWRFQDANRGVLYVASLNDNTGFLDIANVEVAVEVGNKEK